MADSWLNTAEMRGPRASVALVSIALTLGCGSSGNVIGPTPPPAASSLTVSLASAGVVGGLDVSGTVSLTAAAPAAGTSVTFTTSNAALAAAPSAVTIPGGATSATFSVTTNQVSATTSVTLSASSTSGASGSAVLSVQPIAFCGPFPSATQVAMPFFVYVDDGDPRNHFVPSGFFGDTSDLALTMADRNARTGTTAIRIDYTPRGAQRFAGLYWQCPENNWGTVPGAGFNFGRARQVQFWARASAPARAEFKVAGIGRGSATAPDSSDVISTSPAVVELGTDWRMYSIDVSNRDLSRVIGGFMFVTNASQNPNGVTVFLDDITWQ